MWDDIYLAGLWRRTLIQHLAWHMSPRGSPDWDGLSKDVDRTKRIGYPSWSWVTVSYPITISNMKSLCPDAKLVGHNIQLASEKSPFGQVKSARISLDARVISAAEMSQARPNTWEAWLRGIDDDIKLDFAEQPLDLENCWFLYLESAGVGQGKFFIVEKSKTGASRRLGYAEIPASDFGVVMASTNFVNLGKREVVVIE